MDFPTGSMPDICDASAIRDARPGGDALEYFAALFVMGLDGARKASTRDELVDSLLLMATSNGFKPKGGGKEKLRTAMLDGAAPGNNAGPTTASALLTSAEKAATATATAATTTATATATAATTKANAMLKVAELNNAGKNATAVYEKSGKRVLDQADFQVEMSPAFCADKDEAQSEAPFDVDIKVSKDSLEVIEDYTIDEPKYKRMAYTKPAAYAFLPLLRQYYDYQGDGTGMSVALDYDDKLVNVRLVKNIITFMCVRMYDDAKTPPTFKLSLSTK